MKQLLISALLCGCMTAGYAQDKKQDTILVITADTLKKDKSPRDKKVTIEIGKWSSEKKDTAKVKKPSSKFSLQFTFARFDIGLSRYLDNGSFSLSADNEYLDFEEGKTINVGFEFLQMGYRFNSYFKVYLAAGLDWNHIRLSRDITFQPDQPSLTYITEPIEFQKNRFSSRYLRVPLSFQLRTKDDGRGKKVNFVFGPEVGFLLGGKVKQISKENGKDKSRDDYNFEPFRYGASARLGYGGLGIYTKYYFNDVFTGPQSPKDFRNLSFGLMLGF